MLLFLVLGPLGAVGLSLWVRARRRGSTSPIGLGLLALAAASMPASCAVGGVTAQLNARATDQLLAAVALWEREHGAPPPSLEALVPAVLPALPQPRVSGVVTGSWRLTRHGCLARMAQWYACEVCPGQAEVCRD